MGYGTTYAVTPEAFPNGLASTCTKEQAIEWLKDEAENCAERIKSALVNANVTLTQNELDACISFAYNCGTGALLASTFWKNVISGVRDTATIVADLQTWSKANGVTSTGLLKRRNSEAALFLNADYTVNI
ncbi:lysozyme [Clostridium saccharoperbutylacetonicum]|uniref:lysozyme n=1 Tax=Clostridium saccharoperbutylacetonicum TaxID=36745 RepID=UPI000985F7C1